MLNQYVSIDDIGRPYSGSTALSPQQSLNDDWAIDANLKARLVRAAAALAIPSPDVVPGAAVLLMPLDLPLSKHGKRHAAAPFAIEPYLAAPLEDTQIAVGPVLHSTVHLCAAMDRNELHCRIASPMGSGVVLPDLCAVPLPTTEVAWGIWCGQGAIYLRTFDGGGCVIDADSFADLWRAFDRPRLELWHGTPPPGVDVARQHDEVPDVDPSVFALDLRPVTATARQKWRGRLGYAAALSAVAGIAHAAVLFADAHALEKTASEQRSGVIAHVLDRGAQIDFDLPESVLTADLAGRANQKNASDRFLTLLARTGTALSGQSDINFRDMRFDSSAGTLAVLVSARDLQSLQQAENALRSMGMTVTGGAASSGTAGAEMQLILSEPS
ncbi:type II secretion system protein GspL [Tateyamaria armeniaca]|uniref:Type II secretion system protein GspL n=1 Tax=Tateyamaria armeniaca TaxID=2518930 RepID=A0ABW8UTF4_9RHOB